MLFRIWRLYNIVVNLCEMVVFYNRCHYVLVKFYSGLQLLLQDVEGLHFLQTPCKCEELSDKCPLPSRPVDIIWAMIIVWRLKGKIIWTDLCYVVYDSVHNDTYTHTRTWAVLKFECWFRFRFSFWATVCKTVRPMPSDRCLSVCLSVCPALSVTLVYCGQTVRQIKMKLRVQVGLGLGQIVLDGDPAPLPKGGRALQFLADICCGQMAGWIKMPLDREVGLSPSDIVLDGDPALPLPVKGAQQPPPSFRPMSIVAAVAHLSCCWALVTMCK